MSKREPGWVWGKILGFKEGDRVRLITDYPLPPNSERPWRSPWGYDLRPHILKRGRVGTVIRVIILADCQMYIVDFGISEGNEVWVTEYEIEPAE